MNFFKSKWIGAAIVGAFVFSSVFCCCWTRNVEASSHPASCHGQPSGKTPSAPEKSPYSCKVVGLSAGDSHFGLPKVLNHIIFLIPSTPISSIYAVSALAGPFAGTGGIHLAESPPLYILHSNFRI